MKATWGGTAKLAGYRFNPASPDTPHDVHSLRRKLKVMRSTRSRESSCTGKVCVAAQEHLTGNSSGLAAGPDQHKQEVFLRKLSKLRGKHIRTIPSHIVH